MADYFSENEIQNAMNRVNQMRKKADYYLTEDISTKQGGKAGTKQEGQKRQTAPPPAPVKQPQQHQAVPKSQSPFGFLSSLFGGDTDKMLILGLIMLLSREGADQMLLFALLYILM